jgi:cobalt-zinc-cadmium efflux system membrane fusion protein
MSFGVHESANRRFAVPAMLAGALLLGVIAGHFLLPGTNPSAAKVSSDTDTGTKELKLEPDRIKDAGVRTSRITAGGLRDQIIAQATVAATPSGAAIIGARADGTVTAISKRLGDAVRQGDSLGAIQSREAARLAGDRAMAEARVVRARQAFTRQKNLLAANATSSQDYDAAKSEWEVAEAERTRAVSSNAASGLSADGVSLKILSPITGRITAAPAMLGAYVVAGAVLFQIADPTKLEVQAAVPSADAGRISVGDHATIDLPQGTISAVVRAITPDVNLQSRAATVVLSPLGDIRALQPGQLVSTHIYISRGHSGTGALLVPTEALQKIDGNDSVFVRTKEGFRVQSVTTGAEGDSMTEIQSGLKPGDEIATANSFLLKAELQKGSGGDDD